MADDALPPDLPLLTAVEARVLGCLIEKKLTTPDSYPLTLNATLLAVNQRTSRDPVMSLEQVIVLRALGELERYGLVRASDAARTERYEHLVRSRLRLTPKQVALLGLLLLRGPQTLHELHARSVRLLPLATVDELREQLDGLIAPPAALVARCEPRTGQRGERYAHQLCGAPEVPDPGTTAPAHWPSHAPLDLEARVEFLEQRVAAMADELAELQRNP